MNSLENNPAILPVDTGQLCLPRALAMRLMAHAQSNPEKEICGLVSSLDGMAHRQLPIRNIAEQPESNFKFCPEEQIASHKSMRERSEQLLAIYHSHPTAPAVPSAKDIADCGYPEAVFLILSLDTKGVLEMRGWQLINEQPCELVLSILE